jgi:hypothetical protein
VEGSGSNGFSFGSSFSVTVAVDHLNALNLYRAERWTDRHPYARDLAE